MKKALFLTLTIGAFGMMSCNKCQDCTATTYQEAGGIQQQVSATTTEYCGDDYDNAPAEGTVSQDLGTITQSITTTCQDK